MSHAAIYDLSFVAEASGWLVAGTLLGHLHYASLRWSVRCLLDGQPFVSSGLQLLRFALAGGTLTLVTRWFGGMPLLAVSLGLMAARIRMLMAEPQG